MKVVIIGGVAGGASAAARLRRLDEAAEIIIFERSGFISYANCGLPYYIGGTIEDESDLTLQTPQSFWRRFRIDARVRHEVTAIDREKKTVSVLNLETGERLTESYDKLILSPGAVPVRPKLPGIESERIQTLRTVEDTLRIRAMAVGLKLKSAVVVGGGFIGVEMAENLRGLGMAVSLIEMQPQVLGQFDGDMASFLHAHMKKHGVELLLGRAVAGFADTESGVRVSLGDGATTACKRATPISTRSATRSRSHTGSRASARRCRSQAPRTSRGASRRTTSPVWKAPTRAPPAPRS